MKRLALFALITLLSVRISAQINMTDSTAQVIAYWDKNEKQTYVVTQEKYKIKGEDTTSRELIKYTVDITIADSTADSYIVDWFYRDYEIQTSSPIVQKLIPVAKDLNVRIRTDEMGAFKEVVNWQEVRDYILKGTKVLKKETKGIPNLDNLIEQFESLYSTKASIEMGAVKEMHQFYTFHGAKYEYGLEYNADMKTANLLGGEPFDTKVTVWLDELNPEDNNCIVRMQQTIDSEQLTKATIDYLTKMSSTLKVEKPKIEDVKDISNVTWTASRIHGSGWIVYSVETKETNADGQTNVEERIIELQ